MSTKWILLITASIFGSAFFGIALSTIIFDDTNSEKSHSDTISPTKTIKESSVGKENSQVEESGSNKSTLEVIQSASTSTELEGTIISSSDTGLQ